MADWTEPLKETIAMQASWGMAVARIARLHGKSPYAVRQLIATDEIQQRIQQWTDRRAALQAADLAMAIDYAPKAMSQMIATATDPSNKKLQYEANKHLHEYVLGAFKDRTETQERETVDAGVRNDLITELTGAVRDIRTAIQAQGEDQDIRESRHLKSGVESLPSTGREKLVRQTREKLKGNSDGEGDTAE